jgi:aminoglycoside phosphotransferase (APT) family kinase protein
MNPSVDPIVHDAVRVRTLTGFSGACIYLISVDGLHWFVRKAAKTAADSARLQLQLQKQERFRVALADNPQFRIRVPALLSSGTRDGRFFFDMEFVRGTDAASYLGRATFTEVEQYTAQLGNYFRHAAASASLLPTVVATTVAQALVHKLRDVQAKTAAISETDYATIDSGLSQLDALQPTQPTLCHGDFTLENLVVTEQGICALDWLDAPYEHWWFDIAKLHQDLSGAWYQRKHTRISLGITDYISQHLLAVADAIDPNYRTVHNTMMSMNFARILPYCQSDQDKQLVLARVHHFASGPMVRSSTEKL